jgi:hypothetical protein
MQSGKLTAAAVSVASLGLVWGLVWANLPSKGELLSETLPVRPVVPQAPPELDLTIPGVSPSPPPDVPSQGAEPAGKAAGPEPVQAKQIAELKCDAEVQRVCPGDLTGEEHRQCMELRMAHMSPACREIARRQVVQWKVTSDYRAACLEDIAHHCPGMKPGDEGLMPCLHVHAQALSNRCYQSLPKGALYYKR